MEESNLNLRTPGPIPVPDEILNAMSKPMSNHRGPEFKKILYKVTDQLQQVFSTNSDIFILTSSGTGAMEAAIVNTLSPGDKVLCATIGNFGDRFGQIAKNFGAQVTMLSFDEGKAVEIDSLRNALVADSNIKAVLVTHNETNTGVTNDLESISKVVKGEFDKLLLVDGISSLCSVPLKTDDWGCDVVISASQKGWMLPPGLAFISFSERAWEAYSESNMPKFYFDLAQYRKYFEIGQPPYTPGLSVIYALDLALDAILNEGMGKIFNRHAQIGKFTRSSIRSLGLSIFPQEDIASNTVTAVKSPKNLDATKLIARLREGDNIILAGGYGELKDKIFRIGHMGYTQKSDIQEVVEALRRTLPKLGFSIPTEKIQTA